jgi:hypothetical protein
MAKSLRAHCKKRARTMMRETVGTRLQAKHLRKTTRGNLKTLLASSALVGDASEADVRAVLGGAGGASAHLVTLAPRARRALPYSFNAELRAARRAGDIEDETDDDAEDVAAGARNERGDLLHAEPVPTGAKTFGTAPIFAGLAGGDAGGGGGGGGDDAPQPAAATRAFDKPVGKREMSASYYDWQKIDEVNPHVAGFYDVPAGKNRKLHGSRDGRRKGKIEEPFFPRR